MVLREIFGGKLEDGANYSEFQENEFCVTCETFRRNEN
jgi:hypothetical protein